MTTSSTHSNSTSNSTKSLSPSPPPHTQSKHTPTPTHHKTNPLKKAWHALTTGWVLEYPDSGAGPRDFFDRQPGRNGSGNHPAAFRGGNREKITFGNVEWGLDRERERSRDGEEGAGAEAREREGSREDGCLRWCEEVRLMRGEGREGL